MRIFTEPRVYLVARPSLVQEGVDGLLSEYHDQAGRPFDRGAWVRGGADTDGEGVMELMGRLCYGSFGARQGKVGAREYLGNILRQGHGSVLEHGCWSFVVCRASRGYTHQMVRHRAGFGYSQESSHFIRYDDGARGGQEPGVCLTGVEGSGARELMVEGCEEALRNYREAWKLMAQTYGLEEDGWKGRVKKAVSGAIRGLLPTAVESRLGFTGNARAIRHFVELRGAVDNTAEIRHVAAQTLDHMRREAPSVFSDLEWDRHEDGHPVVVPGRLHDGSTPSPRKV